MGRGLVTGFLYVVPFFPLLCISSSQLWGLRPSVALMINSHHSPFPQFLFGDSSELAGALAQFCCSVLSLFSRAWPGRGCCSQRPWRVWFPSPRLRDVPTEVTEFPYVYSTSAFRNLQQFLISSPQYIILLLQPQNVFQAILFSHYLSVCHAHPSQQIKQWPGSVVCVWSLFSGSWN